MNSNRVYKVSRSTKRAFTLLEIMLVIVIIIALAAVVVPNLGKRREQAQIGTTQIQMKGIEDALEYFKTDLKRYPTTEEGLKSLNSADQIQDEDLSKLWKGPYLGKESTGNTQKEFKMQDTWNHEFHYTCPGEHNTKDYDLYSDGPDGQEGTDDDLCNWDKEGSK